MAEAAGLVIGVVALASTFKDCVDLFSFISASKSFAIDFEILNTQLDLEKTLLLQWADRVQLLNLDHYDKRLDDPLINKAVSGVLSAVRLLLSQSTDLQQRYGMECIGSQNAVIPTISGPRMKQFLRDFESLSLRINAKQKEASIKQRFYWVVRDREKFDGLIRQLSSLVGKLNIVIPATSTHNEAMIGKDIEHIQDVQQIELLLAAAQGHGSSIATWAKEIISKRCSQRVIDHLWFRIMDDRRRSIGHAHDRTLEWALHPPADDVTWDDLSQWLRSGSGIYWISGKAGSGKSTLMKYLYEQEKTSTLLKEWAGNGPLTIASFFFYHLGTAEQNTHEGLSRALLYYILSADPSLTPHLLPNMWRDAHRSDKRVLDLPTMGEVTQAFSTLSNGSSRHRFCFFIDGLDEYCGDLMKGIALINSLVINGTIKILLSSRPISACFQAFSRKPKLQLQDLTKGDIRNYINDVLGSHPYVHNMLATDPTSVKEILEDIADKASGVFLWVILACHSILQGFAAHDYPAELRHRVNELPAELEDLFTFMLKKIEPRYRAQAARLLKICHQRIATSPERKPQIVYTLGLALVDEYELDVAQHLNLSNISYEEKHMKCRVIEERLRSRCCGLLEIHQLPSNCEHCFCGHHVQYDANGRLPAKNDYELIDSAVGFMHRCVFDFLNDPHVWNLNCLQVHDTNFEPNAALSRMYLHLAHTLSSEALNTKTHYVIIELMTKGLLCAQDVDLPPDTITAPLFEYSAQIAFNIHARPKATKVGGCFFSHIRMAVESSEMTKPLLASILATEFGMIDVLRLWESRGVLVPYQYLVLLYHAIEMPYSGALQYYGLDVSPTVVQFLLSKSCDPNAMVSGVWCEKTTPWKSWLIRARVVSRATAADVTESFVKAGADTNICATLCGKPLEQLICHWLLGKTSCEFAPGMTWEERAMVLRCSSILKLLEIRQAGEASNVEATGFHASKNHINAQSPQSRRMKRKRGDKTRIPELNASVRSDSSTTMDISAKRRRGRVTGR
ncbi:prion-inhibition and propagation-domain-containing protein [Xylariaceae sp. FL1651]|nr:prion-inhibition and propagation-domain-containing protein [Xylariaceae sp. FL1651]